VLLWVGFWRSTPSGPIGLAVASICGMTAVIAASWAIGGTLISGVLEFLGKRSLEIYIAHVLGAAGMRIALIQLGGVFNPIVHFILGVGAGIAFPLGLWWLASRSGCGFIFSLRPDGASPRRAAQRVSTEVIPA
jgi:peptidoglycan/LPS O-acetylase OafA/YrhL